MEHCNDGANHLDLTLTTECHVINKILFVLDNYIDDIENMFYMII